MEYALERFLNHLKIHIENVNKAYNILSPHFKDLGLNSDEISMLDKNIQIHDQSKYTPEESLPYANHFHGNIKDKNNDIAFKEAVKLHKSRNPHHPEYWEKDGKIDMPKVYVVEMICDWWSFGLSQNQPDEIFAWFDAHKGEYNFSHENLQLICSVFELIRKFCKEENK